MRGLFATIACGVAIGIMGAFLIVSWFGQLEIPR